MRALAALRLPPTTRFAANRHSFCCRHLISSQLRFDDNPFLRQYPPVVLGQRPIHIWLKGGAVMTDSRERIKGESERERERESGKWGIHRRHVCEYYEYCSTRGRRVGQQKRGERGQPQHGLRASLDLAPRPELRRRRHPRTLLGSLAARGRLCPRVCVANLFESDGLCAAQELA